MDPLFQVKNSFEAGKLSSNIYDLIKRRFSLVVSGINRIEKASQIDFPIAYVDPSLLVTSSNPNSFQFGILYARTIPLVMDNKLKVVIQICAPLVAYGLKGTIHAILAHEFLHYLDLVKKVSKMQILSDEITSNLFENVYADEGRLFEPQSVFSDKTLLHHITKKFPAGFRDYKLEDKVTKFWIQKNLPVKNISLDENVVKVPAELLSKIVFDSKLLQKLESIDVKDRNLKKRKFTV